MFFVIAGVAYIWHQATLKLDRTAQDFTCNTKVSKPGKIAVGSCKVTTLEGDADSWDTSSQ
ncbi:hypothetical protein [Nostoc sp. PA-18-2419]|uniref:hypothetical protein n=1 Tax=Nostoc sp. PA-18-2419 TaxID=2575443 RepID=UPI0011082EC7|nr:hypothetical protein [Nostoc sp. PA-18-2419]